MKKVVIQVPQGVRYISDYGKVGFSIPNHPCILDKGLTGCGFTEYCINPSYNEENVILCSPRRMLLENKDSQHYGEVFFLRNEAEKSIENEVGKNLNVPDYSKIPDKVQIDIDYHLGLKNAVKDYILKCQLKQVPCKILVTYDSFRIVKEAVLDLGSSNEFRVVVDEFQSIFTDSRFKSDTELEFVHHLQGIDKLCYVSATPMLEKYLDMLDNFKDLPMYIMDWISLDPTRTIRPELKIRSFGGQSLQKVAMGIIDKYLRGNYEKTYVGTQEIESKEVVFYVNSIKNICDVIRNCNLSQDQVNILCSRSTENQKKIDNALRPLKRGKYLIGSVPKKGESHKMFTFCTRTVYLGADFYSENARTIILSDANIECLAVDITLDLPQILGRQRLEVNPWKNRAELYVRLITGGGRCEEEFNNFVSKKDRKTENLLKSYGLEGNTPEMKYDVAEKYLKDTRVSKYKDDYVAVNQHTGSTLNPVSNVLVRLSEIRAFEIQNTDYKDRFNVFTAVRKGHNVDGGSEKIQNFLDNFEILSRYTERMKYLCDESINFSESDLGVIFRQIPLNFGQYITTLGIDRIKANGYQKSRLDQLYNSPMSVVFDFSSLDNEVYGKFKEGGKYTLVELKEGLKEIFKDGDLDIKGVNAKTILNYFETKTCKVLVGLKNKDGYKLIKRLR